MNLNDGIFTTVEGGAGGNCKACNRIRLSSDGKLKPCLFSDQEYDIKKYGIEKALQLTLERKPEKGFINHKSSFNQMGG
jgi:cyclic pyranopterin phosphate synthase